MTDLVAVFQDAHPHAIDFLKTDYDANKEAYDLAATEAGYRLAGFRLGFAVFTTKAAKSANRSPQKRS